LGDNWESSSNIFASATYSLTNAFSVTIQSLNPFDNQITNLTGEDFGGAGRVTPSEEVLLDDSVTEFFKVTKNVIRAV
jgi:hypothetical protein